MAEQSARNYTWVEYRSGSGKNPGKVQSEEINRYLQQPTRPFSMDTEELQS